MQEGLFEEAGLLREREVDMKVRLGGLPHEAPPLPCVTLADVEAVLSAWTGIPPERMGQDDRDRLSLMEPVLKASPLCPLLAEACNGTNFIIQSLSCRSLRTMAEWGKHHGTQCLSCLPGA